MTNIRYKKNLLYLISSSLLFLIVVEMASRISLTRFFDWMIYDPLSFVINYLIILTINLLLFSIFSNKKAPYFVFGCIVWIASIISGIKMKLLGVPLLPNDITLVKEALDVSKYLDQISNLSTIAVICTSFLLLVVIFFIPNGDSISKKVRLIVSSPFLVILLLFIIVGPNIFYRLGITDLRWNQSDNYTTNGFLLASMTNLQSIKVDTPDNYSLETMRKLKEKYTSENSGQNTTPKANIILVLSESLWDITKIESLKFNDDPLRFYHKLQEDYTNGELASPHFGGGTVNVEFEVLTGNSMQFLLQGTYPFLQFNREIDSIASILSRKGYYTTVLNSYYDWFYNVRLAYQNLGFDQFISNEFLEQKNSGYYLSDKVLMDAIIKQTESTDGYDFIFAKTMETHFPYNEDKYSGHEIKVISPNITEDAKSIVETYAQGISNFDNSLEALINYYTESDEPTVVVVFGDHMPILGNDQAVYKELGYINEGEGTGVNKLHQTPILVWNNFKKNANKEHLNLNATYVTPYILNYLGEEGTSFTNYLWDLYSTQKTPINLTENSNANLSTDYDEYKLFQYDSLFGNQYVYSLEKTKGNIKKKDYFLGYDPEIKSVEVFINHEVGSSLSLVGERFSQQSIVTLDGVELQTSYWNEGKLTALIPDKLLNKKSNIKFQVIVKDLKNVIISSSEEFNYNLQ